MITTPNDQYIHDPELDVIWKLLDYGWLADAARPTSVDEPTAPRRSTATGEDIPQPPQIPTNEPTNNITASAKPNEYPVFENFDINKPFVVHDEVAAMDFMTYPDGTIDSWPDVLNEGDVFLGTDFGISSPWTPRAAG